MMKSVVLVLSERAAELLMWQVDYHLEGRDTDELEILAAIGTEIDTQLRAKGNSGERSTIGFGVGELDDALVNSDPPPKPPAVKRKRQTKAEKIADEMAKATKEAVDEAP